MSQQYSVAFIILFLAIVNCLILQIAYCKWYRRKIKYQIKALARGENINEESVSFPGALLLMVSYLLVAFSIVPFLLFL